MNKREAMGDLLDVFIEVRGNPQPLQFWQYPKIRVEVNFLHWGNWQQEQDSKHPSNHWSSQANLVSDPVRFAYEPWVQKEGERNLESNGAKVIPGPNGMV